ncbi:AraC family transcriptional regulator [Phyllobacterium salinisoli]|uniref:AraC family transcriptional regulator n=2 Tax=Phyllobacterium salinisoli TaxID=1899321 RepID=A0A368K6F7_9HYPH|nr:AraC family transcriptional regulator [Phyllobacterium salinisoli]
MAAPAYPSLAQWYSRGPRARHVRTIKSSGGVLNMLEITQPPGDMSIPAVPDFILFEDLLGGTRFGANHGGGHFLDTTAKGGVYPVAPNFALSSKVATPHHVRSFAFPMAQWQSVLDEAIYGCFSFDGLDIFRAPHATPTIRSALRKLWSLSADEGAPSRLLARAAGCEILAELCRSAGSPLVPARGGLAPWAERRCLEFMHARLSEDISLDELAAEARLSPFHFARMFKQSVGVPPRVYLTRLRMEKACELLAQTDLPVTEIAQEVGYSSNQVLARIFIKHQRMSPSDYRRAVRDPVRPSISLHARPALEGRQ